MTLCSVVLLLQLGEDHDRTNESSECLKHLTQQAVKFQKTMNQLSKGEKVNMMSPIQVSICGLCLCVCDLLHCIH